MPNNNPLGIGFYQTERVSLSIQRKAKYCIGCGEYKSHDDYHRCSSSRDGRRPECKDCRRVNRTSKRLADIYRH